MSHVDGRGGHAPPHSQICCIHFFFLWYQKQLGQWCRKCPLSRPCIQQENSQDGLWCEQPVKEETGTPSAWANSSGHVPYGITTLQC